MSPTVPVKVIWRESRGTFILRYWDSHKRPKPGWRDISAKTKNRKLADKKAGELSQKLRTGDYAPPTRLTWEGFCERYRREKLSAMSANSRRAFETANNQFVRLMGIELLSQVDARTLSRFQALLREEASERTKGDRSDASIATYLRTLRAALGWAQEMGFIRAKVAAPSGERAARSRAMRGRPVRDSEFRLLLRAVKRVRPKDAPKWRRYLIGLYLSGLRLEESLLLSWDRRSPISVDLSGAYPMLRVLAEGEKGRQDRLLPIAPEFAKWLAETPAERRTGPVFGMADRRGNPYTGNFVTKRVAAIGREAGIVVDPATGRTATAHDLRRAFGTRWAKRVMPAVLKVLMRHKSIATTMKFYVEIETQDVAEAVWSSVGLALPASQPASSAEGGRLGGRKRKTPAEALELIFHKLLSGRGFSLP